MGFLFFLGVWIVCEFFIPKFLKNYTSFLLLGLLCGLGGGAGNFLCGGGLDDTDSNSLPHVSEIIEEKLLNDWIIELHIEI